MKRILVCDDDHEIVQAICVYLTDAGFEIVQAYSGKEALQCVLDPDQQIDLIIMDVMMPEVNGIEATKKIRELYNIPIIMLSAKSEDEDKITGLKIGADDYMTKPFLPRELILRISAILRRTYQLDEKNSSIFRLGKREVDLSAGIVRVMDESGKTIQLTNKEYQLLKLFLENRGRILTFDVLSESVWGENYYDYENTLMVHIRRLREKIEEKPSEPAFLITVKGLGYRMNA